MLRFGERGEYTKASNKRLKCNALLLFLVISSLRIDYVSCIQFRLVALGKDPRNKDARAFQGKMSDGSCRRWM